jgi:dCTP diphosphatase
MNDKTATLKEIQDKAEKFIEDREWGQFHSPLNMAMDISVEANELLELFIWSDRAQSSTVVQEKKEAIEHEVADVLFGLVRFCKLAGIDLAAAFEKKMLLNEKKYPVEKARGKQKKYTEL